MYKIVEKHFKDHFQKQNIIEFDKHIGQPKALNNKISKEAIQKAVSKMSNQKAPGRDNIAIELIKYAPQKLHEELAESINGIFEIHNPIEMGIGLLVPRSKPNKPKGPVKNLRPITLLEVIRLSKIEVETSIFIKK